MYAMIYVAYKAYNMYIKRNIKNIVYINFLEF